jgi:hypothetical protein
VADLGEVIIAVIGLTRQKITKLRKRNAEKSIKRHIFK